MKALTTALLASAVLASAAACASSSLPPPSPSAYNRAEGRGLGGCKAAMNADYARAVASGGKGLAATEPAACKGLSDAELAKLAGQVLGAALGGQTAAPVSGNTAACKTYVAAFNKFRHSNGDELTEGATFDAGIAAADAEATGQLKLDLGAVQAGLRSMFGGASNHDFVKAAEKAYLDCFKLGVG